MATFKFLILPHQRREDGTYNVKIRLTQNRRIRYIKTEIYATALDVTRRKESGKEKIKVKNQAIIDLMEETIHSMKRKLIAAGPETEQWDVDKVYEYLTTKEQSFHLDFLEYGRRKADELQAQGRLGTAKQYRITLNALERFAGVRLDINDITSSFLERFERFIRNEPSYKYVPGKGSVPTKAPKGDRAVSEYPAIIKALHNMAKLEYNDEDAGVINIPYSPFARYKIPAVVNGDHRVLTVEQMQAIINLPDKRRMAYNRTRDLFIMSFALMGMNSADFFSAERIDGDIITYYRQKTRTRRPDKAVMQVRIEPEIKKLVKRYRDTDGAKVFLFHRTVADSDTLSRSLNHILKEIGAEIGIPGLNFYYARHTFATLAANRAKIDIATVDEMLNHSDSRLKLARVYIEKDFARLWEANRKVIELFDWSEVM